MIIEFNNAYLQRLFEGRPVIGKPRYSNEVVLKFKKTILLLKNAESVRALKKFRGLNFEALKGKHKGYYSVRVDYHYRLILRMGEQNRSIVIDEIVIVEDLTNHYH